MLSRPKLGYLVPDFPHLTHSHYWSEIATLEAMGVEVMIFSTTPPATLTHAWAEAVAPRVQYLDVSPKRPRAKHLLRALPRLPFGQVLAGEPDLVRDLLRWAPAAGALAEACRAARVPHVHVAGNGQGALIAALAARMGGASYSIAQNGPLAEGGAGQNFKWRGARFGTSATQRILNELRLVLRDDLPMRMAVQATGIDTDFFARDAEDAYRPLKAGEELRLLIAQALAPDRGIEDALEALRRVLDAGQPAHLVIMGEDRTGGSYRAEIAARIVDLGLEAHCFLTGAMDAGEVRAQMLSAHILLQGGAHDALGMAMIEAMACGLPVLATPAGGRREILTDGRDGVLVAQKSPQALAEGILRIAANFELAQMMSLHGRVRIEVAFDARTSASHLLREVGLLPQEEV